MSKKKKIIVLTGMVALLVVTGVLNIVLNQKQAPPVDGGVITGSYFDTYRADKKATRDETLLYLDAIIEGGGTAEARTQAEEQKLAITGSMVMETNLEGLIRALGYDDVVVTASSTYINVIIKAEDLTDVQVASIVRIITTETDKTPSSIRIIPIE